MFLNKARNEAADTLHQFELKYEEALKERDRARADPESVPALKQIIAEQKSRLRLMELATPSRPANQTPKSQRMTPALLATRQLTRSQTLRTPRRMSGDQNSMTIEQFNDEYCIDELRERVSLLIAENNKLRIQLGGKGVRLLPGLK